MEPVAEHQDDDDNDNDETSACPLFMHSLPKNFSENPSLAALASFLDDDDDGRSDRIASPIGRDENDSIKRTVDSSLDRNRIQNEPVQGGGGKVRCPKSRASRRRQCQPYPNTGARDASTSKTTSKKEPSKPEATLGEAQLFLKLWKL